MTKSRLLILVAAGLLVAGAAQAREDYILRFAGASVNPTGDLRVDESEVVPLGDGTTLFADGNLSVEPDNAFGFCVDVERRVNDLMGISLTLMQTDHDLDAAATETVRIVDDATGAVLFQVTDSMSVSAGSEMTPLLVGTNFHFGPNEKVDLYAGPFVGWIWYDDINLAGERISIDNDWTYGAVVGVDVPFGESKLSFSGAFRYMIATATPDEPDPVDLELDPWIAMVGVGYSF